MVSMRVASCAVLVGVAAAYGPSLSIARPSRPIAMTIAPEKFVEAPAAPAASSVAEPSVVSWYDEGLRLTVPEEASMMAPAIDDDTTNELVEKLKEEGAAVIEARAAAQAALAQKWRIIELKRAGSAAIARRAARAGVAAKSKLQGLATIEERASSQAAFAQKWHILELKREGRATVARRAERSVASAAASAAGEILGAAPAGFVWGGMF